MAEKLGCVNPLLYRGYVFDTETNLYYLRSRYYNPELCRFINADTYIITQYNGLGGNLFSSCNNNPAIYHDPDGHAPNMINTMMTDWGGSRYASEDKKAAEAELLDPNFGNAYWEPAQAFDSAGYAGGGSGALGHFDFGNFKVDILAIEGEVGFKKQVLLSEPVFI